MPIRRARTASAVASSDHHKRRLTARIGRLAAPALVVAVVVGSGLLSFDGTNVGVSSIAAKVPHVGVAMGGMSTDSSPAIADASTSGSSTTATTASSSGNAIQTGAISGTEKVYVSVVETTATTSDDVNTGMTQSAVQTMINALNSYWSAQSGGKVTIELGGYETRSLNESSCNPTDALSAEESDAFGGMFANDAWKGTHNHLMVLSTESCGGESFATIGGNGSNGGGGGEIFSGNGIDAHEGTEYLLHEFGHNLGFEHADASICTNTTSYDATASNFSLTSTTCPTREYDDYFDIMGYTVKDATPNLSSPQRIMAGWLTNYATLTGSTSSVSETLTALGGSGGTQALKIVDPVSGDVYYVEYRTDSGLDATSAEFNYELQCDPAVSGYTICELDSSKTTGVIRVLRFIPFSSQDANGTTVEAIGLTAGSTDKTKRHTHLDSGDSFTSSDNGFSFKVVSLSPSKGAVLTVSFPKTTTASTPTPTATPTATPTPTPTPTSSPAPKITAKVTLAASPATLKKNAKDAVKITVTLSDKSAPVGTDVLYLNNKKIGTYTLKATAKGVVSVTGLKMSTSGTNTFKAIFTSSTNVTATGSTAVKVQ